MRRLVAIVGLMLACVCVFPARADAYFWKWLDDLSGPQFIGWALEVRTLCRSDNVLDTLHTKATMTLARFKGAAAGAGSSNPYFAVAVEAAGNALDYANDARVAVNQRPHSDVSELVGASLAWTQLAETYFELAQRADRLQRIGEPAGYKVPTLPKKEKIEAKTGSEKPFVGGVAVSICGAKPFDRRRSYVNVKLGFGYDTKDANKDDENRMTALSVTYHGVVTPYLTFGAGGGVGWFSSLTADSFHQLYIEPYIIDFRPLALGRNSEFRGPWWHVLFVRYGTLTFPGGFDPGQFGGRSPRYHAELIHTIGIHADLEPVMRKLGGKW